MRRMITLGHGYLLNREFSNSRPFLSWCRYQGRNKQIVWCESSILRQWFSFSYRRHCVCVQVSPRANVCKYSPWANVSMYFSIQIVHWRIVLEMYALSWKQFPWSYRLLWSITTIWCAKFKILWMFVVTLLLQYSVNSILFEYSRARREGFFHVITSDVTDRIFWDLRMLSFSMLFIKRCKHLIRYPACHFRWFWTGGKNAKLLNAFHWQTSNVANI